MMVSNMINTNGRAVANQFVLTDSKNQKVAFQSYSSIIVEIDDSNKTITVYPDWDYSRTTGKYRNQFMLDCGFDSLATKKGFEKALKAGKAYCGIDEYEVVAA